MAGLKEIRTRIDSIAAMEKITSAMKLVSASKLRKSQLISTELKIFSKKLNALTSRTLINIEDQSTLSKREVKKILLLLVSSNSGLCGNFNNMVIKGGLRHIKNLQQEGINNISIVCIGKKVYDYYKKLSEYDIVPHNDFLDNINYDTISEFAGNLIKDFSAGLYDRIDVISNASINVASFRTNTETWLPFNTEDEVTDNDIDYLYMPDKQNVIDGLIRASLHTSLYCKLIESFVAEHSARMTSMHKATENAKEMLKTLKVSFNKARQAAITNEIIEITNGANALNS